MKKIIGLVALVGLLGSGCNDSLTNKRVEIAEHHLEIGRCYVNDGTLIIQKFLKEKDTPEFFKNKEYSIQFYDKNASLNHSFVLTQDSIFKIQCNDGSSYHFLNGDLTKRLKNNKNEKTKKSYFEKNHWNFNCGNFLCWFSSRCR